MLFCSKFSQLCFCQILFELVYSWVSYHKNEKGELFIETQCISLLSLLDDAVTENNKPTAGRSINKVTCYLLVMPFFIINKQLASRLFRVFLVEKKK